MKVKQVFIVAVLNFSIFARAFAADCFNTVFGKRACSYEDWINQVWDWAMIIIIPLSVLILSAAGVIYMVSEGDSNRIGLAKKLLFGVFSGVGLLVLARVILSIIGIEGNAWNIN